MNWTNSKSYTAGTVVVHQDKLYQKLDDGDNSPPDDIAGGWVEVPPERNNLAEYTAIEASLGSYEARKAKHQADVRKKLAAAGLDPVDVLAVLNA
jgi:hypothetical protein